MPMKEKPSTKESSPRAKPKTSVKKSTESSRLSERNGSLTLKQEKFVIAVAEGKSQADAYRLSYNSGKMTDKTIHENASRLMADPKVKARCEELRGKVVEKLEAKSIVTIEGLLKDLQDIKETSLLKVPVTIKTSEGDKVIGNQNIDSSAALKAIELMGKHLKMFTDKLELGGELKIERSDDELESRIRELERISKA